MEIPNIIAPPPWNLTGKAYIFLYKFSKNYVQENAFLQDYQKSRFLGYFGTVMLVNYESSPVGPYKELLFIPGLFTFDWKKVYSISKIYVSTYESVYNGIENWGIPKELADFDWNDDDIKVSVGNEEIFSVKLKSRFLKFPITTSLIPLTVVQKLRRDLITTKPSAKGNGQLAKVLSMKVNPKFFPDLSKQKPLLVTKVNSFEMMFNIPTIQKDYFPS